MTTETKIEKLTITLTGIPPVQITKADWPVLASAEHREWDNTYEFQANRKSSWKLIVRQHEDGRTIVYGIYTYVTQWEKENSHDVRGGEMLAVPPAGSGDPAGLPRRRWEGLSWTFSSDAAAVISAIQRVGAALEERMPSGGVGVFPRLVHECIADLPALEL